MSLLTSLLAPGNGTSALWIPSDGWVITNGSPSQTVIASIAMPGYLFDAATFEGVGTSVYLPSDWNTLDIDLYWTNAGAGSGDVDWETYYEFHADTDTIGTGYSGPLPSSGAIAAPAQNVLKISPLVTGVSITAPLMSLKITRRGSDAGDTLANDATMAGVLLTKAS